MDAKVISAQFTVEVNNQPSLDVLADALNFSMPTEAVQSPAAAFEATPPSSIVAAHASNAGLIALVSLLGLVYLLWRYPDNAIGSKRRTDLKGPKGLPLIGNLRWALSNKDPLAWQVEAQAKYGYGNTFTLPVLGRVIDVSRPDWIEHVQKSNFTNYAKGQAFHDQMQDVLGDGIFTMDGDNWKVQRKVASRIFSVNTFKHIITSVVREDVKLLDSIMRKHAESGEAFNLQDLFFRFTLSSFVKIAFSTDTGSLSHPDQADEFGEAFAFAQKVLDQRFVQPWWRISEKYNETGSKMRAARKVIDDFTEDIVSKRLEERKAGVEAEEGSRKDLLDLFADYRFKDGNGLNHKQLKDTILNLLIAGRDTTAEALSWMSWHMLTKPEVMDSVRSEADKFAEENGSLDIDYDDFEQHTSKLSVFHETLRLHPSIPKNIRVAAKDDVLPNGGPRIDKGDVVLYSDWAMARNPDVWGPDAATFNPRRWMSEEGTFQRFGQFKAHFFSGGPRLCLGQRLATYEVCQVVNAVFGRFDMELVDLGPKKSATFDKVPEYLNSLTHPMKRPLMVRVKGVRE